MRIKGYLFLIFKCCLVLTIILCFISSKKNNYKIKALENFEIKSYRLSNKNNISIEFLNLGGIITSIKTPDKNNQFSDIVLGFEDFEKYHNNSAYFGAIVGRYANRIESGKFKIDGNEYHLKTNNGLNHLHGGHKGFDKVFWQISPVKGKNAYLLYYMSPDGEEGYPGNLEVKVTYELTDDNNFKILYEAASDKKTIINLSQHSYFNLSGNFSNTVLDHLLKINSKFYLPVDKNQIPTGVIENIKNTPFDFEKFKFIGLDIEENNLQLKIGKGYDHCYVIKNDERKLVKAASLYHSPSSRLLEVYTDQPGIQFYSGNFLDNSLPSKTGGNYRKWSGLCLETQHFPNSPNNDKFPLTILRPGEKFYSETWFKFSVIEDIIDN